MTKTEIVEMVKKAYMADEFTKLFLGEEPYKFDNLKHIPANVPTDLNSIIEYGLYPLYQSGLSEIPEYTKNVIKILLTKTALSIWTAYSIIWSQYWNELEKNAPFQIVDDELLEFCRKQVKIHSDLLRHCNDFIGKNNKEGLLGDILRLNVNFKSKFGVSIL